MALIDARIYIKALTKNAENGFIKLKNGIKKTRAEYKQIGNDFFLIVPISYPQEMHENPELINMVTRNMQGTLDAYEIKLSDVLIKIMPIK